MIFIGVAGFYFTTTLLSTVKAVTPIPPASKIVREILPEKYEELQQVILELEDKDSDVWNSFLDGMKLKR